MGNKTPATTTQTNSGTTVSNPYAPATSLINSVINKYSGINTDVTPGQTAASTGVINTLQGLPGYNPQLSGAVGDIFKNAGMLNQGYDTLKTNLGGIASGSQLNPYDTPGFGDALKTASNDITNQVKGVYAASGRNPSGSAGFGQTLARGLAQGLAPTIQSQFNTNQGNMLNANNTLFGAGNTTAGALNSNTMQALQAAGLLPGVATAGGNALLGAENTAQALPYGNLQQMLSAAGLLGSLGGSSTTNSTSTGTQTPANDPLSNWLSVGSTIGGLAGAFSDRRLKENVKEVGKLHDGQKVYRFNFKGQNTPQIGLMAQDVEKRHPEAVQDDPSGYKRVRYDIATRFAGAGMHHRRAA